MFTGIIEAKGQVLNIESSKEGVRLLLSACFESLVLGESIAIDGVCLTLISHSNEGLVFDISPETLRCTTLSELKSGMWVNLERAMPMTGRFGGHYVSGHVDMTALLVKKESMSDFLEVYVDGFCKSHLPYLVPKGSITIDGVSLTINRVEGTKIILMLVPHTLSHTTLGEKALFSKCNVEFDYFARLVAHQFALREQVTTEV